jgi:hypothetical protein
VTTASEEDGQVPALPVVPNAIRFTIEGTTPAHAWVNTFHWGYTGPAPLLADLNDFAATLYAAWVTDFAPLMLTAGTIERATAIDLSSTLGVAGEDVGTNAGSRGTAEIPAASSVLISKTIGRRYRGGHPRSYIFAGIQTDLQSSSLWATAFTLNVATAYAAVTAALTGHTHGAVTLDTEVVVSYVDSTLFPLSPHFRTTPLVLPVLGVAVQPEIAIQRRRVGR